MYPFSEGDTFGTFDNLIEKVIAEINLLDNEYVLKASPTELEQYFVEKALIKPLILHEDERYIKNQSGTQIDVSNDFRRAIFPGQRAAVIGTRVDIAIPFEGDPILWRIRASTFSLGGYPEIDIRNNEVVFTISFPDDSAEPDRLRNDIERLTKSLVDAVNYLKRDADNHNNSAPNRIREALTRKRTLAQSSVGAVAAMGIPMKKKDAEPTFTIPAKRRESPGKRPPVATGKYEPEPILDEKEYQYILEVLKSMSLVIERNPSSFASLDEEAIRDHFLLQLNGHYEGGATGETFNASGKTDILIRVENKNVFIAECKFWHGPKAFDEAIDQLLGYLTWRDSKCALLVFNKTKDSSAVRQKIHEVMESRSQHRKTVSHLPEGDSRYVLVKDSDPGREISVTTQLYDMPSKE
jgi:hypothetical protein